jgi:hypothetical protein
MLGLSVGTSGDTCLYAAPAPLPVLCERCRELERVAILVAVHKLTPWIRLDLDCSLQGCEAAATTG